MAALQVISDEFDDADEVREPCSPAGMSSVKPVDLESDKEKFTTDLGSGKNLTDLVDGKITLTADPKNPKKVIATGKLKAVTLTTFPGDNNGHFFPVLLDSYYEGQDITCQGHQTETVADLHWVLSLKNVQEFKFYLGKEVKDENLILDLDLTKMELGAAG